VPADARRETLYDDPELSPNGDRIAFSTDRGAAQFDEGIAVVNRDGSGFRRVTTPPVAAGTTYAIDVAPAWSPDGSRLLFTRITTDASDSANIRASTALLTVPAAGGTPTPVPNATDGYLGDWSPDGSQIVFTALTAGADTGPITVVRSDGTQRRTLAGADGLMPAWSPDGTTIAFARVTSLDADRARAQDVAQLATVPAGGGAVTTLAATRPTAARTVAGYPAWSPDGESLLFDLFGYSATDDFPPGDVWAVDRDGIRAGRVTTSSGDDAQPHAQGPAPTAVSAGTASTYVPVTPQRVLDTRNGLGVRRGKVGQGAAVDLAVAGVRTAQGPVPAGATAVVLNVTVTDTTAGTDVRAYPAGTPVPLASNLNAARRATVPNLVTVRLGADGRISLRNGLGSVHLIADIAGYYTPDASGAGFAAVDPSRILDTRVGLGAARAKLARGGATDLQVTGALRTADGTTVNVPADARAVVLNVTATAVTGVSTDVRVYPAGGAAVPLVSNLNLVGGQTAANLVTVAVGAGGRVRLRNSLGSLHLIADLAGYYAPSAPGRFVPVAPTRFLDTRSGTGAAVIPTTAGGSVDVKVGGTRGVPGSATAAVLNLTGTAVSGTASTDVRAYPRGAARVPTVSNVNLERGDTRANLSIVRIGSDGRVRVRNSSGQLQLVADLAGYMVG
jgi:WD40-like Beta Propeller Repeat